MASLEHIQQPEGQQAGGGDSSGAQNRLDRSSKEHKRQQAKRSRSSINDDNFGNIKKGIFLFIVGEGNNIQERVVGCSVGTTLGKDVHEFVQTDPLYHQYDFLELHQFPNGRHNINLSGIDFRLDANSIDSNHASTLVPLIRYGYNQQMEPVPKKPEKFVVNSPHFVLGAKVHSLWRNHRYGGKNNRKNLIELEPDVRFVKQSTLYEAITQQHDVTVKILQDNITHIVLGPGDVFDASPYPYPIGINGLLREKTFNDFFLELLSIHCRVPKNIPCYPPLSMSMMSINKRLRDSTFRDHMLPYHETYIPNVNADMTPIAGNTWVDIFKAAAVAIPRNVRISIVGSQQWLQYLVGVDHMLEHGLVAKPWRRSSGNGQLHIRPVVHDGTIAGVQSVTVSFFHGGQVVNASPGAHNPNPMGYNIQPFVSEIRECETRFFVEARDRAGGSERYTVATSTNLAGDLSFEAALVSPKALLTYGNKVLAEFGNKTFFTLDRLKHVMFRIDYFVMEQYDLQELAEWEANGRDKNTKREPKRVTKVLNEVHVAPYAFVFLGDCHGDSVHFDNLATAIVDHFSYFRGGDFPA